MASTHVDYSLKTPPHSPMAEQAVLGGLLLDNNAWHKVANVLSDDDFFIAKHRFIFKGLRYLLSRDESADVVSLADCLASRKNHSDIDIAFISALARDTPSAANIDRYAAILREKALLRQLIDTATALADKAYSGSGASDLLDEAETAFFKLNQQAVLGRREFVRLADEVKTQTDLIESLYQNPPENGVLGIGTGFSALDSMTSGWQPGDLIVIAARPSMGKTALVMNMAESAAKLGKAVAVFSLEMSAGQLAQRLLSTRAGLPLQIVRQPWKMWEEGWPKLTDGIKQLVPLPMWINDSANLKANEIRALCLRLNAQVREEVPQGLGMIVVDYLQLMAYEGMPGTRSEGLGDITRSLKQLAKELNVPVLLLSQLNREVEKRGDKRPHLSDLRDSGAIEQDADVVLFVYRDEKYVPDTPDKGVAEIIFAKQRNGALGTEKLGFKGSLMKFYGLENRD